MACRLVVAKSLSKPMLGYCWLDPWEQTSVKSESKFIHFYSRKCIWKSRLENGGHFVTASMCLHIDACSKWPTFWGRRLWMLCLLYSIPISLQFVSDVRIDEQPCGIIRRKHDKICRDDCNFFRYLTNSNLCLLENRRRICVLISLDFNHLLLLSSYRLSKIQERGMYDQVIDYLRFGQDDQENGRIFLINDMWW